MTHIKNQYYRLGQCEAFEKLGYSSIEAMIAAGLLGLAGGAAVPQGLKLQASGHTVPGKALTTGGNALGVGVLGGAAGGGLGLLLSALSRGKLKATRPLVTGGALLGAGSGAYTGATMTPEEMGYDAKTQERLRTLLKK